MFPDLLDEEVVFTCYAGSAASALSWLSVLRKKGYRLISANLPGCNFIFLKNEVGEEAFPEVNKEDVLSHPFCADERLDLEIWSMAFERPEQALNFKC